MAVRDVKIIVQRFDPSARNGFNEVIGVWVDLCAAWAARSDLGEVEKLAAGFEGATLTARFTLRSNTKSRGITPGDRLLVGAAIGNIKAVLSSDVGRARSIVITAVFPRVG